MNGISSLIRRGWLILPAWGLFSCLQGPWDYVPEPSPLYRGLWAQAYVVGDRPVTDVCFERFIGLDETQTPAFAFYDSAEVGIEGRFTTGEQTLLLRPQARKPNCFIGDTASRAIKGESYTLRARIVWDSLGNEVVSHLLATSTMADSFAIKRTAVAPSVAFVGGFGAAGAILNPADLDKIPAAVGDQMAKEFEDEIETLLEIQNDSVQLNLFFNLDGKAKQETPGERMMARLFALLKEDEETYQEGDSLFYISNKALNLLSHTFTSERGKGVHGVLVTQRWDTNASRVINPFQTIAGSTPDPADFYYPGNIHRLLFFPEGMNSQKGFNFLDSIGVVNTWFFTGRNRLYFYATDTGYAGFLTTNTNAGDSPENNPKITAKTNITGGKGFFAALAVDSFDVFIKADPADEPFPLQETRAAKCSDDGWFKSRDCIDYYREWCSGKEWRPETCGPDRIRACIAVNWDTTSLGGLCIVDSLRQKTKADSLVNLAGYLYYCIENDYPDSVEHCEQIRSECENDEGSNPFKEVLWEICDLRDWTLPACRNGMVTYCRDAKIKAPSLCKAAQALCREPPKPSTCP